MIINANHDNATNYILVYLLKKKKTNGPFLEIIQTTPSSG